MTRATPGLASPSPSFHVQQTPYTADLQWNRVSNLEPSGLKAGTLPLGHRGPTAIERHKKSSPLLRLKLTELWSFEFHNFKLISGLVDQVLCIDWWIVFEAAIEMV
ncbi:hypothetical protein AVEN_197891-1 [Araneus ventricosus]|uniref:Uncharacterized protein n=1 Tax=Araneus ventricosus TaxID=182803 RepID=A0A4Y2CL52_ARAVE|nr:hypothetical protein AVEN_197891-1 [Araneus ventricosus]